MKVYTVSDLHVDYAENMDWILSLHEEEFQNDLLILPGDVSNNLSELAAVFESLAKKFRHVHFVPGNHELWIENEEFSTSLDKFDSIIELCAKFGVETSTQSYGKLTVVPLFSWYDFSFGAPDRHLRRAWRDFRACKWPAELKESADVNAYFLELNKKNLSVSNEVVISYSHFLPRIDVMPSYIPQDRRRVYPVLGSEKLGDQINTLSPDIHIYGHSHVNQEIQFESTKYINNAFAYPTEERIARKSLFCVSDSIEESLDCD